jgi:HK97 family phage prohead protease
MTTRKKRRHSALEPITEIRHFKATGLEVREAKNTNHIVVSGMPIVYNAPYTVHDNFGKFTERMMPGVASNVLDTADVRFLFDHSGLPLARTTAGTLSLRDSDKGVLIEARLDARQQLANDLGIAIERGDVSQMSCGFIVARDEWDEAMEDRSIHEFRSLLDVSAVTYPASPTTTIGLNQSEARAQRVARGQLSARSVLGLLRSNDDDAVMARMRERHARHTIVRQAALRGRVRNLLAEEERKNARSRQVRDKLRKRGL